MQFRMLEQLEVELCFGPRRTEACWYLLVKFQKPVVFQAGIYHLHTSRSEQCDFTGSIQHCRRGNCCSVSSVAVLKWSSKNDAACVDPQIIQWYSLSNRCTPDAYCAGFTLGGIDKVSCV